MTKSMFNYPVSSAGLELAITDVIKSAALEETALSAILNLEKDIIQKAKNNAGNIEEFVSINESVNSIIRNVTKLQMLTHMKLQYAEELLPWVSNCAENGAPEKSPEGKEDFAGHDDLEE